MWRRMRSKLFIPCSRPELFAKALAGPADALSFDLEDSVPDAGKAAARDALSNFLGSHAARSSGKTKIVRINAVGSAHFAADLASLAGHRFDLLNLPKVEDTAAVLHAATDLDPAARLLVNIESATGMANAVAIAAAHPRIAGLQVGLNDLFASLGADRREPRHVHAALWTVRLASAAAGCFAYDGAWPDLNDEDGFRVEAELARSLGYLGKSCVHPRQVAAANAVFDRTDDVAEARRLLAAAATAERDGRGAFAMDGRMIDRPAIEQARAVLAAASA